MPRPYVEITRSEEFCACHRLHSSAFSDAENAHIYGVCNNLHGHNYVLEVTVRGPVDKPTGMVMNLTELMRVIREKIIQRVDHKSLNDDVLFLAGVIPTAENVSVAFWAELEPEVRRFEGCQLHRIRLYESRSNFVDFHGPSPSHAPSKSSPPSS